MQNLFTGWKNPGLTETGAKEAINAGKLIKDEKINFDTMYTSELIRAQLTGNTILEIINQSDIPIIKDIALNENYGSLAGLNKDDARKKWGKSRFIYGEDLMMSLLQMGEFKKYC